MGVLSSYGVSKGSKSLFDKVTQPFSDAMNFVRDHPMLMKCISVAFPPARGVITATEMCNSLRTTLGNSDREEATKEYKKSTQSGGSLLQQLQEMAQNTERNNHRQAMGRA